MKSEGCMKKLKIIHLENNGIDAELVALALSDRSYPAEIVVTDDRDEFCQKLDKEKFDLILMDYDVPSLSAAEAIQIVQSKKITTPIIIVSGAIGYNTAIQLIKQGAFDYVLKQNLAALPDTINRALSENQSGGNKKKREEEQNQITEVMKVTRTGIFKMDLEGNCFSINQPLCDMLGYSEAELGKESWLKCIAPETRFEFLKSLHINLKKQMPFEIEAKLITKDNQKIWVKCNCIPDTSEKGKVQFIGAIVDITDLKKAENELINLSMHDVLTGLPNRRYFAESVQNMIHECERGVLNAFAVFYIDLDHFKKVNDILGHHCGDQLLMQAAERFKSSIRKYDIIARIGGDEFLVVFKHINSIGEVAFLADNLLNKFRIPFYVEGHECLTTLSIGVAYVNNATNNIDAESIIQKADQALYRSKARGRNCYEIFTDKISHEIQHTAFIEGALRHAIEKNEFSLVFQPQVDLLKSCIFGFEVLLRWKQSVYGDVSPSIFIPIAEESGQINVIGSWVIDAALNAFQTFLDTSAYFRNHAVFLSVNVSATQLLQDDFILKLLKKIKSKDIDPNRIIFEVTETNVIQNIDQLKTQLSRLDVKEIRFAIDDFGAGYSSFTHLKELPVEVIKIDQTFVQSIDTDPNCKNIIKSIISLAKAMNITLIAEGVETKEQADFLYQSGCYILQGYYFSKSISLEEVESYMKDFKMEGKF